MACLKNFILSVIFCLTSYTICLAQNTTSPNKSKHILPIDSLKGFDEESAKKYVISEGFLAEEFDVRMFQFKRQFVNNKFHLNKNQPVFKNQNNTTSIISNCVNEDFEASIPGQITSTNQINGWIVDAGTNTLPNNSCNLLGCCPGAPSESQLINIPAPGYIDPVISGNYPIYSVFGANPNSGNTVNPSITNMFGNKVIRLNSNINNMSIERISKTINVTPANAVFNFAFISVFFTAHACCDAGAIQIKFTNLTTNSLIACPNFSLAAPGPQCTNSTSINYFNAPSGTPFLGTGSVIYNKWNVNSIDLTPYLGSNIFIEVIATDCTAGGHYGYAYFDASCSSSSLAVNGTNNGGGSYTICDPIFSYYPADTYLWNGPVGSGITNVTTQTINLTASGIYTLTSTNNGCPNPITQTLNITLIPPPSVTISASSSSICLGGSVIMTTSVTGATSYSWNTGSSNPSIFVSPTSTTVYSVTANYFGSCAQTSTFEIIVDPCITKLYEANVNQENILVYPNSIQTNVTVKATGVIIQEININNSIGQLIYSSHYENAAQTTIDCSKFSTGIYFMKLKTNKGTITKKIIKE